MALWEVGARRQIPRGLLGTSGEPLRGAEQGALPAVCPDQRSGCCAEDRQGSGMEGRAEALTSIIQVRDEDRSGSHGCHEKRSASGYVIYLLKKSNT